MLSTLLYKQGSELCHLNDRRLAVLLMFTSGWSSAIADNIRVLCLIVSLDTRGDSAVLAVEAVLVDGAGAELLVAVVGEFTMAAVLASQPCWHSPSASSVARFGLSMDLYAAFAVLAVRSLLEA